MDVVKVKLLEDWMGHPAGSSITVGRSYAEILHNRKAIEYVIEKENKTKVESKVEVSKEEPADTATEDISSEPVSKMRKRATVNKMVSRSTDK